MSESVRGSTSIHLFEFRTCVRAIPGGELQPLHLFQSAKHNDKTKRKRQQCTSNAPAMHQHIMLESQGIWFQGFYMIDSSYILQNLQIYINILDMIRYVSFSLALDFSVTFSPSTHWRNSPHVPHVFWLCRYQKARVTSGLFLCTLSAYLRCSMMFHWSMTPNIKIALLHSFTHWQCLSKLIYEIIILNICLLSQKQRHIKTWKQHGSRWHRWQNFVELVLWHFIEGTVGFHSVFIVIESYYFWILWNLLNLDDRFKD